jgi:hypothetical protein
MRTLVLILLALGTAGCPGMGPVNTGGGLPLSQARLTTPTLTRMRATATISQTEKGKRLSGKVYVMLERPGSIRFDAMSPVDTPMAILTANESTFALMDVKSDAFYTGPPSACNVARMLQIPLPPAAVAGILTGTPPLMDPQEQRLEWKLKGYHLLTLRRLHDMQVVQIVTGRQGTSALRYVYWHKGYFF